MSENEVLEGIIADARAATGIVFAPSVKRRREESAVYKWFAVEGDGRHSVYRLELRFFALSYGECLNYADAVKNAIVVPGEHAVTVRTAKNGGGCGYISNAGLYFLKSAYEVTF